MAQPLDVSSVAQHPFMARNGWNSMHGDGHASDTHPESGPLGIDPEVISTARGLLGGDGFEGVHKAIQRDISGTVQLVAGGRRDVHPHPLSVPMA